MTLQRPELELDGLEVEVLELICVDEPAGAHDFIEIGASTGGCPSCGCGSCCG